MIKNASYAEMNLKASGYMGDTARCDAEMMHISKSGGSGWKRSEPWSKHVLYALPLFPRGRER